MRVVYIDDTHRLGFGERMGTSEQELMVEDLYIRHHAALRQFLARMLRCEEAAAEVAQEAWLRLIRYTPRHDVDNPKAYLFRVAANAARDHIAREHKRNSLLDNKVSPEAAPCAAPDEMAAVLARERLRILAEAVDELPPRCREVFLMSRLDGLANGEIAAQLGISRNMVEKHIIRAMLQCRRHLDAAINR